jgi:superfamily I DNA/RNA helicase/RecB family exonuclease
VDLTAAQQQVVGHGGRLRVTGGAATGKSTALRARYLSLATAGPASRILAISRDRTASTAFRDEILVDLRGGFDALPITTVFGVAHDLVSRAGDDRRLLGHREQWTLVERLLAAEEVDAPSLWPTLHPFVGRRAFVDEVARAVLVLRETGGRLPAGDERWAELASFEARYRAALDERGAVDGPGLVARAAEVAGAADFDRFDHVLVDDGHDLSLAAGRLVALLGERASTVVVAGDPEVATRPDLDPAACLSVATPDPADSLVLDTRFAPAPDEFRIVARHPSVEPEAIAAVLLESAAAGVDWGDMAVLVRSPAQRGRAVVRALARHGIPVSTSASRPADEPVVRAIVDVLRWVGGDELALERVLSSPLSDLDAVAVRRLQREAKVEGISLSEHAELASLRQLRDDLATRADRDTPARLAYSVYRRLMSHLVTEPDNGAGSDAANRALDAVVALVDGLSRWSDRQPGARLEDYLASLDAPEAEPDPWRTSARSQPGVTVTSIQAATGRRWHTVVVAGCLEGELPRVSGFIPFFDPLALPGAGRADGASRPTVAERRARSLAVERRRFHLARTRATARLVASAGPEPKDIVSRFVERWPEREAVLPAVEVSPAPHLLATPGVTPVFPDSLLRLSASQLNTYEDCGLKYAYSYGLRVRDEGNVWSGLGTYVHDVLERFLQPGNDIDHSLEALRILANERWSDDIATYRPQREELRRQSLEILDAWWESEGQHLDRSTVVAVEHAFDIEIGPHRIRGKIDRVDRTPDGRIEIVDYKTGKKEISDDAAVDDLQLATYHLAAERDPKLSAEGSPDRLRLLYLRSMHSREQPITDDHAVRTEARILAMAEQILTEQFQPSVSADCDHCDFHRLCPLQPEGREVGAV